MQTSPKPIELAAKTLDTWCQLATFGTFTGKRGDETVEQVIDRKACDQIKAAFAPEVLVDFEHRAENTDDTQAAGWVQEIDVRDDGLWARVVFTDIGAEAIHNRRLRYLSPVWPLDADGRPTALKSVALTNTPNFQLRPVLNKAQGDVDKPKKGPAPMKQLAALYGLPETATEAEIIAAATAEREKAAALETRLNELEKAALNTEAEKVVKDNEKKIENKEAFKALYVQNKQLAIDLLATIATPQPVTNKSAAKAPAVFTAATAVQNKLTQYDAMAEGRDKTAFLRANAQEINTLRNDRAAE